MVIRSIPKAFRTPNQLAAELAPDAATLKTTLATLAAVSAQSATPVAVATKVQPVPTIGLPTGKPTIDVKKANDKANAAMGEGAAESFIACIKGHAGALKGYLVQIVQADQQWRKAFRVGLDKHRKAMADHVAAMTGTPEHAVFEQAMRSAKPRISEAIGFSKAIDAGFVPDYVVDAGGEFVLNEDGDKVLLGGYHAIVAASIVFRNSTSSSATDGGKDGVQSVGPTKRRGRVATPVLDKVKNFLLSLNLTAADLVQVRSMVDTLATLAHAKDKPATM